MSLFVVVVVNDISCKTIWDTNFELNYVKYIVENLEKKNRRSQWILLCHIYFLCKSYVKPHICPTLLENMLELLRIDLDVLAELIDCNALRKYETGLLNIWPQINVT